MATDDRRTTEAFPEEPYPRTVAAIGEAGLPPPPAPSEAVRELGRHYAALVRALPQTRQVLLEATHEGPRIWTVIDAEPFNGDLRMPVFAAELEALDRFPGVVVDFRLVNVAEYEDSPMAEVLPSDAEVLWRRES
jgi:hypothetical protein